MKWLPHFCREKMEQWCARGDMPWYESTLFKRAESGEVRKFNVAHFADESEYAAKHVHFATSDLLKQTKMQSCFSTLRPPIT